MHDLIILPDLFDYTCLLHQLLRNVTTTMYVLFCSFNTFDNNDNNIDDSYNNKSTAYIDRNNNDND